jgi:hypothetical protein
MFRYMTSVCDDYYHTKAWFRSGNEHFSMAAMSLPLSHADENARLGLPIRWSDREIFGVTVQYDDRAGRLFRVKLEFIR